MQGSSRARRGICTWAALLSLASTTSGQGVTVRGIVYDSLHSRPLGGAMVAVGTKTTTADSVGRFTLTDVPPGDQLITAQHDAIDRLGISAIGAQIRVSESNRDLVTISLPSFTKLWRQVCGPTPPATDTGFVFGTVRSATLATVSASWIDLAATGTKVSQKMKTMEVEADSDGNYALCGVPTTTGLTIRASADSVRSGAFDIAPMDRERVVRRDITLLEPKGALFGKVLADSGRGPIANVELTLIGLGMSATTNDKGEYAFSRLAAGSHQLNVRKIGYAESNFTIELDEAARLERDIVLNRVTVLDSVEVKAKPLARNEGMRLFEENRKLGLGKFITQAQLDSANGRILPQFLVMLPSLVVFQDPGSGKYKARVVARGPKSLIPGRDGGCGLMVFVDGVMARDYDLNDYPPSAIAGVEYYRGPAQIPPEYGRLNACSVIAIHLRK